MNSHHITAIPNLLCVWPLSSKWNETRDPAMETVIASDIYYKHIDTFSFLEHYIILPLTKKYISF